MDNTEENEYASQVVLDGKYLAAWLRWEEEILQHVQKAETRN